MALIAHPDRDNVWVKPELIKPEWLTQEWIRPENGFEFLSKEPAWGGMAAAESALVSVTIDLRPTRVQIG